MILDFPNLKGHYREGGMGFYVKPGTELQASSENDRLMSFQLEKEFSNSEKFSSVK